jgi:hypothetical protein
MFDETSLVGLFPNGEARTGGAPGVDHLGIRTRRRPYPFQEVKKEIVDYVAHGGPKATLRTKQRGLLLDLRSAPLMVGTWIEKLVENRGEFSREDRLRHEPLRARGHASLFEFAIVATGEYDDRQVGVL